MHNHESLINDKDLEQLHLDIGSRQWQEDVERLFEREPMLATAMAFNWERLDQLFTEFGLNAQQRARLKMQVTLLMGKGFDRGHRRLWDDVLPQTPSKDNPNG